MASAAAATHLVAVRTTSNLLNTAARLLPLSAAASSLTGSRNKSATSLDPIATCRYRSPAADRDMTGFSAVGSGDSAAPIDMNESSRASAPVNIAQKKARDVPCSCSSSDCDYCMHDLNYSLDSDAHSAGIAIPSQKKKKRRYKPGVESDSPNTFYDLYCVRDDILGEGAQSSVHTCTEKASGKEFAVKIVHCVSLEHRRRLLREIEILHLCQHQEHIVHLKEYFEAKDRFYVVFYKANGGPLLEHIRRRGCFSEGEVRAVIFEIVEALVFLHHKGIAHRDLKPANILCERGDQVTPIRICDFDLGSSLSSTKSPSFTPQLGTPVGSCEFMAPEVIAAFANQDLTYDKKCDMWSLGVILFIMLSGRPPFGGGCGSETCPWEDGGNCAECQEILIDAIKHGEVHFPTEDWYNVSESAKELIRGLLTQCPRKRMSATEVQEHSWMTQEVAATPLNTAHNLNVHGTQTHAIPRLMIAYSVSHCISQRPLSSNSPHGELCAEHGEEVFGSPPRKAVVRAAQSSPPSLYFKHLNNAVQSAFSSPEEGPLTDIFGQAFELGCEDVDDFESTIYPLS